MIITSLTQLKRHFHELGPGDIFCGLIGAHPARPTLLTDLTARGVHCLPAPLAQLLNGSKVAQTLVLGTYMLPHTTVAARRKELFDLISVFNRLEVGRVVTKEDGMHCGGGVRLWESVEALYSCLGLNEAAFPLVVQPFNPGITDVRVVVAGNYVEAYVRSNDANFRANIASGGRSRPHPVDARLEASCREIMARARFPYAHLDLHIDAHGALYLSEIALNGGIRGAQIDRAALEREKQAVLDREIEAIRAAG